MLVAVLLEDCGCRVTMAANAQQVDELVQKRPDVMLSDIGMPVEDGYELIPSRAGFSFPPSQADRAGGAGRGGRDAQPLSSS